MNKATEKIILDISISNWLESKGIKYNKEMLDKIVIGIQNTGFENNS